MLWLALVFPEWPLQARFRTRDGTQPLAVSQGQRVIALDAVALAQGVRVGQRLADALALAPDLVIRSREPAAETAALHDAAGCALHFTPHVSLDDDALLLELSGSLKLFGGLDTLLRTLQRTLAAAGFESVAACAPTPRAARWLALGTPGQRIRNVAALPGALAPLPLVATGAGDAALLPLRDAGVRTLGELMALPRSALALRDAGPLLTLIDQALGRRPDLRVDHSAQPRLDSRVELPVPRQDSDVLLFAASRLFNAACARLAAAQSGIGECALELEHERQPPTVLTLRTGQPTRDPRVLAGLAREHLARIALPAPVAALRLQATDWLLMPGRSRDLFGAQAPSLAETRAAAALLVERLRARLGHDKVHALSGSADPRPECAQQPAEPGAARPGQARTRRPLWLLAEPEALAERDGQPWRHGPLHCLEDSERIEAGWWDGLDAPLAANEALRDYRIAIGPRQEVLWIYREHHPPHRWYLHGVFG